MVPLKLFLNAKCSLSLSSKLTISHGKWFLNTNLFLIKTFLITKFDCIYITSFFSLFLGNAFYFEKKLLEGWLKYDKDYGLFNTYIVFLNWKPEDAKDIQMIQNIIRKRIVLWKSFMSTKKAISNSSIAVVLQPIWSERMNIEIYFMIKTLHCLSRKKVPLCGSYTH